MNTKTYATLLTLLLTAQMTPALAQRTEGDSAFQKHNYKEALQFYQKAEMTSKNEGYLRLQILKTLVKLKNWDTFEAQLISSLKQQPEDVWKARIYRFAATAYEQIPHRGYKRKDKIYRDTSRREGQLVYLYSEDHQKSRDYDLSARHLYESLWQAKPNQALGKEYFLFNLHYLQHRVASKYFQTQRKNQPLLYPQVKFVTQFNPDWHPLKQAFMLYQDNQNLARWLHNDGLYVENEYNWANYLIQKFGAKSSHYPHEDPLNILRELLTQYPKDILTPEIQYVTGNLLERRKAYIQALELYQSLISKWPKSPFVGYAKSQIQEIKWPQLSIRIDSQVAPQTVPEYQVFGRNTPQVNFRLNKIKNQSSLLNDLEKPEAHFRQWHKKMGKELSDIRQHYAEEIAQWKISPTPKPHHTYRQKHNLPKSLPPGAYILEASTDELWTTALILVSDLAIAQEKDQKNHHFFVAHAQSGEPISGAQLIIKEYDRTGKRGKTKITRVKTNQEGLYTFRSQFSSSYSYVEALAVSGQHLAMTRPHYWSRYTTKEKHTKVFVQTDRPIYRPDQTVQFKLSLRDMVEGTYQEPKQDSYKVWVLNPKGEKVFETQSEPDEQGQIFHEFSLPKGAALGVYRIVMSHKNTNFRFSSGQTFRVEEYKRPEFKVKVMPQGETRPGERASVKIKSDYFFGAPVSNAEVSYTVFKKPFYMASGHHYPYRWLYGDFDPYSSNTRGRGQVVIQDKGKLNAKGELNITFPTEDSNTDYTYEIKAEVVDPSRRMQAGVGRLNLTHQGYYAFLKHPKGFYSLGERVDTEINLKNANGDKVPDQQGAFKVYQMSYLGKKPTRTLVHSESVVSDKYGRVFTRWTPQKAGEYQVAFEGVDKYERKVRVHKELWIAGADFKGQHLKFDKVELFTDKRIYKEGDTARILINSKSPKSHIWLFEDGGKSLISNRILHLKDHSEVITLKIKKHHVPNFNLKAVMFYERTLFQDNKEIFVPPVDQLLQVALQTSKSTYLPGEKARVSVQVKDHLNRPVQTALTLGVTDASIYEIEGDNTGDIRKFFYGHRRYFSNDLSTSLGLRFPNQSKTLIQKKRYPRKRYPGAGRERLSDGFNGGGRSRRSLQTGLAEQESSEEVMDTLSVSEAPAPEPMAMPTLAPKMAKKTADADIAQDGSSDRAPAPTQTRRNFSETAYFNPMLKTDTKGVGVATFDLPDSLTTWKVQANALSFSTQVGQGKTQLKTTKNILLRLQAPRFFIEKDEVVLSANITNQFASDQRVTAQIQLPSELKLMGKPTVKVSVPAKGQKRVDWRVKVVKSGMAKIAMKALNSTESDAVEMQFPVKVYGSQKTVTHNGSFSKSRQTIDLNLPTQRIKNKTQLKIQLNPSLAGTLLDALPYLAEYPYGCIEQTTSRFVPAMITAHTLKKRGIRLQDLGKQGLNTGLLSTHNPVADADQLQSMINHGLKRIYNFQNPDGGWGWWSGYRSDPYMTAYVLYALQIAEQTEHAIQSQVINKGLHFLKSTFKSNAASHRQAFEAYVLSLKKKIHPQDLEALFNNRDQLSHYAKALLALAYHHLGDAEKASLILQNLKSFVHVDAQNQTASWKAEGSFWWYWYNDRVETNAFILKAFTKIQSKDPLVPQLVRWLVNNRQGNRWKSTKDTAHVIYAMNDYLEQSQELNFKGDIQVKLNGKTLKTLEVNPQNVLTFERTLHLPDGALNTGKNTLTLEKSNGQVLYYSAELGYFTQEENIKGAGNEILIDRKYYLVHKKVDPKTKKVLEEKVLLKDKAVVTSGDEIEVKMDITSKNDYEYLMFEDFKPAGFETLTQKSGYVYQNGIYLNRELRDDKVVFFMTSLPQGNQVLTYRLRAEIPGYFHALPHHGEAMYAPRVSAISDSFTMGIKD